VQTLKVISRLMDYPSAELHKNRAELYLLIGTLRELSPDRREGLLELARDIYDQPLLDAEAKYTALFDSGRYLSLHLFEHVHGESRDRGQAMVDLMAQYEETGIRIAAQELPDYIPLYLEFLATREPVDALIGIADVAHILNLLYARLHERQSPYQALFSALLQMAGISAEVEPFKKQVAEEMREDTTEAMDREWEEEAVSFGPDAASACSSLKEPVTAVRPMQAEPVHFVNK